jgi:hypothetical protein
VSAARIDSMHIVYDTHPLRERVGDKYAPGPALKAGSSAGRRHQSA